MSQNNDDVLDDWEEIDEVSLTSKLEKLKKESAKMNNQTATTTQTTVPQQNGKPIKMLMMPDDDYRTQYGPQEPTVKILKRPAHHSASKSGLDAKPKAPMKTLQQREHEYAQARLRIMGSAQSPEDNTDILGRQNSIVINTMRNSTSCRQPPSGSSCTNLSNGTIESSTLMQVQRPQDGVIRLPRGPNGTTGFMIRR